MNDDQLRAHLDRRANTAKAPDLLPAVRSAIDTRQAPVPASRFAPLAGLVGIGAALLLLVVALPRLTPGPSATESPTVLTTADFAARLAAGDLDGDTLLVSGRIEAEVRRGPACRVDESCYFGTLVASEPPVDVVASAVPTVLDDPLATTRRGGVEWSWWRSFQQPVDGILLLSVNEESRVEFIGVSQQDEGQKTLEDVRSTEIESLAVEDVLVVTAWLGGGNRVPCPPQVYEVTRIPGLPGSLCHKPSWLHDDQFAPTSQVLVPEAALQVQNLAYGQFAAEPTYDDQGIAQPEEGTYALARRLQGWCDGESAPCWRWNVVARLTPPSDEGPHVSPEPTPSQIATPQIAPSPTLEAASIGCARSVDYPSLLPEPSGPVISIVDHTGYIDSCTSWASEGPALVDRTDPNLAVIWQGTACDTDVELQFRSAGNRFELASTSPPIECDSPAWHGLIIRFTQPMPTELIDVYLGGDSPIPTHPVTTRTVECTGAAPPPEPGAVSIEDHTGLINGCEVSGAETPETTTLMSTTDPPTLTMTWLSPCASDVALTKLGFWHRPQAERDHVMAPELSPLRACGRPGRT
jgi:hypothetical protein